MAAPLAIPQPAPKALLGDSGDPRRTKIVATIGPASRDPETLALMVDAGMDVARLNCSHGTREEHAETLERIRLASDRAGRPVAVLQDLPGPKMRVGQLRGGVVDLARDAWLTFCPDAAADGTRGRIHLAADGLAAAVAPGEELFLADGAVRLRVTATRPGSGEIDAVVEVGGTVVSRQGLNVPGAAAQLVAVPEEDLDLLRFGEQLGLDLVALSFVRSAEDVATVRAHTGLPLVAKIEKAQAIERMDEIVRAADCVMIARGDLGIELPLERVPLLQKEIIALAGRLARPAITATQMLDSMVRSVRPTRAEVSDVANAILDGSDAVMLSQETAIGAHPVEAVATMAAIAAHTERAAPYERWNEERVHRDARDPAYAVAYAAAAAVRQLNLDALVVATLTGRSARLVAAHRPAVPVIALSPNEATRRRCACLWGVHPAAIEWHDDAQALLARSLERVRELDLLPRGARIALTAGFPSTAVGTTNLLLIADL
jgi:pyruvate kinase